MEHRREQHPPRAYYMATREQGQSSAVRDHADHGLHLPGSLGMGRFRSPTSHMRDMCLASCFVSFGCCPWFGDCGKVFTEKERFDIHEVMCCRHRQQQRQGPSEPALAHEVHTHNTHGTDEKNFHNGGNKTIKRRKNRHLLVCNF